MTQQQPPQRPMIPFNPVAVPQEIIVVPEADGRVSLVVISPLTTTVVMMTNDAALKIADDIREKARGLKIVDNNSLFVDDILNPGRRD